MTRRVLILFFSTIFLSVHSVYSEDVDFEALLDQLGTPAEEPASTTPTETLTAPETGTSAESVPVEPETATPETEAVASEFEIEFPAATEPAAKAEVTPAVGEVLVEEAPVAVEEPAPAAVPVEETRDVEIVAEAAPEAQAAAADPVTEEARRVAQQEEIRRKAADEQSRKDYKAAKNAIENENYEEAVRLLEQADRELPPRPKNDKLRDEIRLDLLDSYIQLARERIDTDINFARKNIDAALKLAPENSRALAVQKKVAAREQEIAEDLARPRSVMEQAKYSDKYENVDQLLRNGRDLFEAREYNDAEVVFEQVLLLDEYNVEAMRYLRKLEERRLELRTKEREATVAGMIADVRDTWNPPIRGDIKAPTGAQQETKIDTLSAQQKLQKKMESIIIPQLSFRQANIEDVVDFLVTNSVSGDPEGTGVNIILKIDGGSGAAVDVPAAAPADAFGESDAAFDAAPVASSSVPTISLNLRRITLLDAIKYVTEVADLRYRLEENVVIITPANVVSGRVITRMYPVQPSILDVITETKEEESSETRGTGEFIGMGGGSTTMKRSDVKDFFERAGVPFPAGTSITYNQSISQLIVANTAENLENFERILSRLNVIPNQVEIEARFVEVNQDVLDEFGFQWFLTDNWEIAQKKGGAFPAATETIIMGADAQGLTKGNRFFGFDTGNDSINAISTVTKKGAQNALGGVATFASVLTNPELQVVINALSQNGNSDLLSAPRVTTRSGVNAEIQVVNEIIYPTEFESEVTTISREVPGGGTAEERFVSVTPGTFSTREVGVILNVTPTVGPDGYTIDLALVPEVAELVDWIQYGSSFGIDVNGDPIQSNIPQPTFSSRKVTTSIVAWDGATVVMGGLIREDLVKYEDKIPILGDIPLLGRLFRSEGEYSKKKNLLIFVTARLVGPDGRPIQRGDNLPDSGETAEAATP